MHGKHLVVSGLFTVMSLISTANVATAQEKSYSPMRDFGKSMIERPLERTLGPTGAIPYKAPAKAKAGIEAIGKSDFVNPKVEPGQVTWHQNFKEACTSAKTSGKPVLLFQMMGKLDDRFC
jgi:hypothetical protein